MVHRIILRRRIAVKEEGGRVRIFQMVARTPTLMHLRARGRPALITESTELQARTQATQGPAFLVAGALRRDHKNTQHQDRRKGWWFTSREMGRRRVVRAAACHRAPWDP
jgi:hypothetical protein